MLDPQMIAFILTPSAVTIILGILVAVPATVAAVASLRNAKKLKTNHGLTLGEHVEQLGENVEELARQLGRAVVTQGVTAGMIEEIGNRQTSVLEEQKRVRTEATGIAVELKKTRAEQTAIAEDVREHIRADKIAFDKADNTFTGIREVLDVLAAQDVRIAQVKEDLDHTQESSKQNDSGEKS